ncbi:UNVERIFIED_CONTAM: hypothetical protein FKN15_002297 [Acipenser sinensis]
MWQPRIGGETVALANQGRVTDSTKWDMASASRFACIISSSNCRRASHANRFTRSSTKDSDSSCITSTNRYSKVSLR